jgi:murein DD-endopeptidase MepM/ murein hydrolase activator NlpD
MNRKASILILCWFLAVSMLHGQNISDLKSKKSSTQKEIERTNELLKNTEKDKESSLHDILLIERNIFLREKLLTDIDKQIHHLQEKIADNSLVIESLVNDLKKIKDEYSRIIYHSYINQKFQNNLMFVLSSESFNQAYTRIKYIQYYSRYRNKQLQLINVIHQTLYDQLLAIEKQIADKTTLLIEKQQESVNLAKEKMKKENYVSQLNIKEETLRKELSNQQRIAKKLEDEINRFIIAEANAKKKNNIGLTPEETLTSNDFQKNMGALPWPTEYGVIIRPFGNYRHPVLKGTVIPNNGIDISTNEGAVVRALFDGEVKRISHILGANYFVLISHGKYYTVYKNLVDVNVQPGQKVKVKQPIGKVFTDKNDNSTILHLEIWEERNRLNPELWLSSIDNG